jgi:hypothetical protein
MPVTFWLESLNGSDHSEDLSVDGRIILKWILGTWLWGVSRDDFIWLGIGMVAGSCK